MKKSLSQAEERWCPAGQSPTPMQRLLASRPLGRGLSRVSFVNFFQLFNYFSGAAPSSAVLCSAVRRAVVCSAVQCSAVLCSAVRRALHAGLTGQSEQSVFPTFYINPLN